MITKLNEWVVRAMLVVAAVLAFLICFLVCADVIGRVVFNSPVKGTPEIVSTSIVIICFLQAGFAIRSGGMLNVDVFVKRLPPAAQSWMVAIGSLLGAAFFAFLCWGSLEPAVYAWTSNAFEGEGALRVPTWPTRFVLVIGTALAASSYLITMLENIARARAGELPTAVSASH